jgi:phosphonate transport system permease protein
MTRVTDRWDAVRDLARRRSRITVPKISLAALTALAAASWWLGDFNPAAMLTPRRLANVRRFLGEVVPYPLQDSGFDAGVLYAWMRDLLVSHGLEASLNTLAISIAAITLAGMAGMALAFSGARNLVVPEPYLPTPDPVGGRRFFWTLAYGGSRMAMVFVRAIPEYIWAFLFLAMLGPLAWALVLALAVHNAGILGRLGSEAVENTETPPLVALRALGATRIQLVTSVLIPTAFPRFLLFFLYRWETCVREATVLGMLGISSLGFWIQDARARNFYDEMFFLVVLGGVLVLLGDIASAAVRQWVRNS